MDEFPNPIAKASFDRSNQVSVDGCLGAGDSSFVVMLSGVVSSPALQHRIPVHHPGDDATIDSYQPSNGQCPSPLPELQVIHARSSGKRRNDLVSVLVRGKLSGALQAALTLRASRDAKARLRHTISSRAPRPCRLQTPASTAGASRGSNVSSFQCSGDANIMSARAPSAAGRVISDPIGWMLAAAGGATPRPLRLAPQSLAKRQAFACSRFRFAADANGATLGSADPHRMSCDPLTREGSESSRGRDIDLRLARFPRPERAKTQRRDIISPPCVVKLGSSEYVHFAFERVAKHQAANVEEAAGEPIRPPCSRCLLRFLYVFHLLCSSTR